jgi:hypothetical protein
LTLCRKLYDGLWHKVKGEGPFRSVVARADVGAIATRDGRPFSVGAVTMRDGKIVELDFLADPERLAQLDGAGRLTLRFVPAVQGPMSLQYGRGRYCHDDHPCTQIRRG